MDFIMRWDSESVRLTDISPPTSRMAWYNRVKSKPVLVAAPPRGISRVMTTCPVRILSLTPTLQVLLIQLVLLGPRSPHRGDAWRNPIGLRPPDSILGGLS